MNYFEQKINILIIVKTSVGFRVEMSGIGKGREVEKKNSGFAGIFPQKFG